MSKEEEEELCIGRKCHYVKFFMDLQDMFLYEIPTLEKIKCLMNKVRAEP